jgi:hypothetical protein
MNMRILLATASVCLAMGPFGTVSAKLYKWVDENGNVTYSERKPPADVQSEPVKLRGIESTDDHAQEKLDQMKDSFTIRDEAQKKAEADEAQARLRADRYKKNCEIARQNLQVIRSTSRVTAINDEGERYYLSDEELGARRSESEAQVTKYCD